MTKVFEIFARAACGLSLTMVLAGALGVLAGTTGCDGSEVGGGIAVRTPTPGTPDPTTVTDPVKPVDEAPTTVDDEPTPPVDEPTLKEHPLASDSADDSTDEATDEAADDETSDEPVEPPLGMPADDFHGDVLEGERQDADLVATNELVNERARRRMDLDQLDAAVKRVTGGIGWTSGNNDQVNEFERLSGTLGQADYIEATQEDLEPGALFQKFLEDAARSVCTKLVERELAMEAGYERVFFVHADPVDTWESNREAVERNLQYLLLRFHGRSIETTWSGFNTWTWLVRSSSHLAGDPAVAWTNACITLITHSDFYTY